MTKVELAQLVRLPARSDHYDNVRFYRNQKHVFGDPSQCEVGPDALLLGSQNAPEEAGGLNDVIQAGLNEAEALQPTTPSRDDI